MREDNPLVSIIVITYNSAKFVLETLESAKAQSYQNIELIVSDDCSQDNTVEVCKNWIEENDGRFVRTELITVEKNSGIPANCNRGVKAAKGEWVKLIAGDDLLVENAIEDLTGYANFNNNTFFIFSDIGFIDEKGNSITKENYINKDFFNLSAKVQNRMLIIGNGFFIPAATSLINKEVLLRLGGFDEEIKYCEDYPMWIKATRHDYNLSYLDVITAKYRIHSTSITSSFNRKYNLSMKKVFFKYRIKELLKLKPFLAIELLVFNIFREYRILNSYLPYFMPSVISQKIIRKK